ncbi:MAG: Fe-S-containing protein [Acidobacteriota bacterium]
MSRLNIRYAMVLILLFAGAVWAADYAFDGGFSRDRFIRVGPDDAGMVVLDVADVPAGEGRFYRFLNYGNQEVKFFVARDLLGKIHVAFDASENHYKTKRGFTVQNGWVVDNKCDTTSRIEHIGLDDKVRCRPVAIPHQIEGNMVVLKEDDILRGWRYFR